MKLTVNNLAKHLQQLLPVYLIFGDEPLLVNETHDCILTQAKKIGFQHHVRLTTNDQGFSWEQLFSASQHLSLFSNKTIIDFTVTNGKPGKQGSKVLCDYLQRTHSDVILLITMPRLDNTSQRSKWFKAIDQHGAVIPIWPINNERLPQWLKQRINHEKMTIEADALAFFASMVEGNLLAAQQALEKIKLVSTEKHITLTLLKDILADNAHYDIFQWVDACLMGNTSRQTTILQHLRAEGIEAVLVLWAIARELRLLTALTYHAEKGTLNESTFKQLGIPAFRQQFIRKVMQSFHYATCQQLLVKLTRIDRTIKGITLADTWHALHELGTCITLRASNKPIDGYYHDNLC